MTHESPGFCKGCKHLSSFRFSQCTQVMSLVWEQRSQTMCRTGEGGQSRKLSGYEMPKKSTGKRTDTVSPTPMTTSRGAAVGSGRRSTTTTSPAYIDISGAV